VRARRFPTSVVPAGAARFLTVDIGAVSRMARAGSHRHATESLHASTGARLGPRRGSAVQGRRSPRSRASCAKPPWFVSNTTTGSTSSSRRSEHESSWESRPSQSGRGGG